MLLFSQIFAIFCSMILPIILAIYICIKKEGKWKILLVGALTYVLFQMALFLPSMSLLSHVKSIAAFIQEHMVGYVFFMAILTPILAEAFRLLMIHVFIRNDTELEDAFAFGIGYGGIETALSVGMNVLISTIAQMYGMVQGVSSALLAEGVGQLCLLVLQVGYTLLIMQYIRTHDKKYFLSCLGVEIVISIISNVGQNILHLNIWILLLFMVLFAILVGMYIAQVYKKNQKESVK